VTIERYQIPRSRRRLSPLFFAGWGFALGLALPAGILLITSSAPTTPAPQVLGCVAFERDTLPDYPRSPIVPTAASQGARAPFLACWTEGAR